MNVKERIVPTDRLTSIDALRGFDMFWIAGGATIFNALYRVHPKSITNGIYHQLNHTPWGFSTLYDLIFPLFVFTMGVVVPFSIKKRLAAGEHFGRIYLHIIKRTVLLFFLGLLFYGLADLKLEQIRWLGILQRISLCYFIAAIAVLHTGWRTQIAIAGGILLFYWAILSWVPVPGFGAGDFSPEGNLSFYLDRVLLPGKKICNFPYGGDNEGILSTLPYFSIALSGVLAGQWLRSDNSGNRKAAALAICGIICLMVGFMWGLVFPIIEILSTSSFVMVAVGWSLLLLSLFYWVIDVKGCKRWAFFFVVIGANAITIYLAPFLIDFNHIVNFFVHGFVGNFGGFKPLFVACMVMATKWLFLLFLYRHRLFFRV